MIEDYLLLLREFGFPMFVVLWFMFRTEKILKEVAQSNHKLSDAIANIGLKCPYLKIERGKIK